MVFWPGRLVCKQSLDPSHAATSDIFFPSIDKEDMRHLRSSRTFQGCNLTYTMIKARKTAAPAVNLIVYRLERVLVENSRALALAIHHPGKEIDSTGSERMQRHGKWKPGAK